MIVSKNKEKSSRPRRYLRPQRAQGILVRAFAVPNGTQELALHFRIPNAVGPPFGGALGVEKACNTKF